MPTLPPYFDWTLGERQRIWTAQQWVHREQTGQYPTLNGLARGSDEDLKLRKTIFTHWGSWRDFQWALEGHRATKANSTYLIPPSHQFTQQPGRGGTLLEDPTLPVATLNLIAALTRTESPRPTFNLVQSVSA